MVGDGGRYAAGCVDARFGTLLVSWMGGKMRAVGLKENTQNSDSLGPSSERLSEGDFIIAGVARLLVGSMALYRLQ